MATASNIHHSVEAAASASRNIKSEKSVWRHQRQAAAAQQCGSEGGVMSQCRLVSSASAKHRENGACEMKRKKNENDVKAAARHDSVTWYHKRGREKGMAAAWQYRIENKWREYRISIMLKPYQTTKKKKHQTRRRTRAALTLAHQHQTCASPVCGTHARKASSLARAAPSAISVMVCSNR